MKKQDKTIICPICKGKGHLSESFHKRKANKPNKEVMAKLLRKEGYSIREIMKFLEYKSPRSVLVLINK